MRLPFTGWWCGYWEEAKINREDIVDDGTSCPNHKRNDGGDFDRGCREVTIGSLADDPAAVERGRQRLTELYPTGDPMEHLFVARGVLRAAETGDTE